MRVGECDRASRLVAAASCATACAQLASAHHRERDAPPITLSLVRTVPWYGCPSCDRVALADPLSRLSFFRTTAVMERYVTRVRECLLRGPLGYKHPVPFVSRADSTSKFGPHVYNIRFACCLYKKKKKRKKGLARESFVQEQGKGYTVILYQCVNSVSIERVEEETRASPRGWNETVSSNRVRSEKLSSDSFRVSKMNYGQWRNL